MATIAEELRKEGHRKGFLRLLLKQLRLRFGKLDDVTLPSGKLTACLAALVLEASRLLQARHHQLPEFLRRHLVRRRCSTWRDPDRLRYVGVATQWRHDESAALAHAHHQRETFLFLPALRRRHHGKRNVLLDGSESSDAESGQTREGMLAARVIGCGQDSLGFGRTSATGFRIAYRRSSTPTLRSDS